MLFGVNSAELFDRYSPLVMRRATAILGDEDEAKDVLQDVFLKVFVQESYEERGRTAAWLYRITTNFCLNRIRDSGRQRALRERHLGDRSSIASPDLERVLLVREILSAIEEREAQAAIYVYVDGMSHREAAEMIGVSKRTIGNLLERFQQAANARLGEKKEAKHG